MSQPTFLLFLYGALFLVFLYHIIHILYSVYYTPGTSVVYNSAVTQKIFPSDKAKLSPTWGTNSIGRMKEDPTKYGQEDFWPESGQGYVPRASGSGGPSPSGGERSPGTFIPTELRPGYGALPTMQNIYEQNTEIPEKTVWPVGWWGSSF